MLTATSMRVNGNPHKTTIDPPPPPRADDAGDVALRYELPLWLTIATGNPDHRKVRTPVINMTMIEGPGSGGQERENATHSLQAVMADIDRGTDVLHITGDVPTNDQWEALGQYFTKVRFLKVATGWDEDWIDAKFPLNWPLELLIIADAISERITTPAILEGRINHLVFLFACGLRFEGPSVKDLLKDAEPFDILPRPKKPEAESQAEGATPKEADAADQSVKEPELPDGIKVYSVPNEWSKWMFNKYEGKEIVFPIGNGDDPPSAMKTLDILGNDALQMLTYIALAKFHLLACLENLTIYSSHTDLSIVPTIFVQFVAGLLQLKHFKITLNSATYATVLEGAGEPFLHAILPPSLETLRLRGPISAASQLDEFVVAFADPEFLPNLKHISLVLDMPDKSSEHPNEASLEQLRAAHEACKKVLDVAAARGAVVETFEEPWVEIHPQLFREVDNRWEVLDSIAKA
jgi:hypothetical protein